MAKFKKPADITWLGAPYGPIGADLQQVKDRDFKAPPNHIQCILDGLSPFFWFGQSGQDDVEDHLKETTGNIFFFANKILKEDKEAHTKWTNAYTDLASAIKDFIIPKKENILSWTGTEDGAGAKAFYEAECNSASTASSSGPAKPV